MSDLIQDFLIGMGIGGALLLLGSVVFFKAADRLKCFIDCVEHRQWLNGTL